MPCQLNQSPDPQPYVKSQAKHCMPAVQALDRQREVVKDRTHGCLELSNQPILELRGSVRNLVSNIRRRRNSGRHLTFGYIHYVNTHERAHM